MMLLEKPDDEPLGWLPQTYHQMDLKKRKDLLAVPRASCVARANQRPVGEARGISAGPTHWRYFHVMRPLRYSINVTLDGCCDHRAIPADEELHRHAVENLAQADALLFGRVTYEMMEAAWRPPARTGTRPDWMEPWMEPFARTIDAAKKYVVSSTLDRVDWNAELVRGDPGKAVQQLKRESGNGLFVAGVKLPFALTELGLIDEYEFVVHPRLAGHGPTLFAGLSRHVDLKLVRRLEFGSGAVAMRYEPRG
jgi:dihydrofolate reductase